jgi:hypothetical protein
MQRAITSSAVKNVAAARAGKSGEGDGSEHIAELRGRVSLIETMHNAAPFDAAAGAGAPTHAKSRVPPGHWRLCCQLTTAARDRKAPLLVGSAALGVNNSLTL